MAFTACRTFNSMRLFVRRSYRVLRRFSVGSKFPALLLATGLTLDDEQNKVHQIKIEAPDTSTLTHDFLIRNASAVVVDYVGCVLTQTTMALADSLTAYAKAIWVLITLMEYRLSVLGNPQDEDKMAELILEARDKVTKAKEHKQDLDMLMSSVQRLVTTAAEVSYIAGAEYATTCASERLQSAASYVFTSRATAEEAEAKLVEMQLQVIDKETQFAKKQNENKSESIDNQETEEIENSSAKQETNKRTNREFDIKDIFEIVDDPDTES
ncbi:hypothetical protein ScPMuIL_016079 [Solemya velum]